MTIGQLKHRLIPFDDALEVVVRCAWEGEPRGNVFQPRVLVQDVDHDTDEEFVAIECDQDED
jgi:hypothetical protein